MAALFYVQEDVRRSNAREDYPVPEENQDGEPPGANRRGQCDAAATTFEGKVIYTCVKLVKLC